LRTSARALLLVLPLSKYHTIQLKKKEEERKKERKEGREEGRK
jgi:hypothetical protein